MPKNARHCSKPHKLLQLFIGEAQCVRFEKTPVGIEFGSDRRNMDTQWQHVEPHVVTDTREMFHAANVAVFTGRMPHQSSFFTEKTVRKLAGVHKRLQNPRKT